ncbi:MAG: DNA-processing protein DprA [Clostridia bacterium]|nr:DNA-processing protein DprA [Clostridia bacterium]MBQ7712652.1 DNA-processing protein DprA [Clostridia bacterium]
MRSFTRDQLAAIKLASIEDATYRQRREVLALTPHLAEVFDRTAAFADRLDAIHTSLYGKIADVAESFDEERFLRYLEKVGASVLFPEDPEYPERLKVLDDHPLLLFYRGDLSLLGDECFAIVGTRAPTRYGRDVTEYFADELSEAGFTLVSGLARGVDAIAHRVTLDRGRRTIAVIGCGVDKVYPAENKELYDRIAEKGLILSEYFLGAEPLPFRFPERNRLISALSEGVLVTEAGIKSGTMITVDCALDQGRDVFLVPGNIFSAQSKGANEMLHNPQCLIATSAEDVLGYYKKETKRREEEAVRQLSADEVLVYAALSDDDRHFEELLDLTGLTMGALMATLTKLEVLGVIKKLPGNYYGI